MPRKEAYPRNGRTEEPTKRNGIQLNISLINGILKKNEIMPRLDNLDLDYFMYPANIIFNDIITELKFENYRVPVDG